MIQAITSQLYASYSSFFQPLLALEPHIALGVFSVTLAGIYSVIHWYVGDHERIASIKQSMEEHQDKASKAKEEGDEEKAAHHQKKSMSLQQNMMMANFKPIIVIMVFSILFFPWMRATYSPTIRMNRTRNHTYTGRISYAGRQDHITVVDPEKPVVEVKDQKAGIGGSINDLGVKWQVKSFKKDQEHGKAKLGLNADFLDLPAKLPLVGNAINWLGFYIMLSIPFSNIFRRLLGIA